MRACAVGAALVALAACAAVTTAADAQEIQVRIDRVRALDKIDLPTAGQADFYAQITVDGKTVKTKHIRRADDIQPNWVLTVPVGRGVYPVKLEIYDNNVTRKDTLVDINRLPSKRDLDFEVDTRSCVVKGFVQDYKCRWIIKRAGDEQRRAEIEFSVDVKQ
jgi:hypothetical protein